MVECQIILLFFLIGRFCFFIIKHERNSLMQDELLRNHFFNVVGHLLMGWIIYMAGGFSLLTLVK